MADQVQTLGVVRQGDGSVRARVRWQASFERCEHSFAATEWIAAPTSQLQSSIGPGWELAALL